MAKVLLVGTFGPGRLEQSYEAAFRDLECEVKVFDMAASVNEYCRLGKIGSLFNEFVPIEPWIRKANRELALLARRFIPDLLLVFGQSRVRAGALAQIRSSVSTRMVFIWPDTLVNLSEETIAALPLYDLVACYGREAVAPFQLLGSRRVEWVPLAGDPHMHLVGLLTESDRQEYGADISFIGGWNPEREDAMRLILTEFQNKEIKIWGPAWNRRCRGKKNIVKAWQGRPLYGEEFAKVLAASQISLNVIDDTNYPTANMRFFEIPMAGGLQLCSPCPEMEEEFKHGETVFYYHSADELCDAINILLADTEIRQRVATKAHEKVLNAHMYVHRARQILEFLL